MTIFRLALALCALTFVLLLVGGAVNPTGSSLACPDWPLCYGEVFPAMEGGVLYEHSHRLVASAVGLLTVVFAVACARSCRASRGLKTLAGVMVAAVVVQGVLGGVTVIYKLPTLVSTAHLGLSMVFFGMTLAAAFRAWPGPALAPSPAGTGGRRLAQGLALAVWLQVILGGLVRHTGAGRACGTDFPSCGGELWPALGQAQLHQAHRLAGLLLGLALLAATPLLRRAALRAGRRAAVLAATALPLIVVAQVVFGILTVLSGIGVWQVVAHTGGGALLLASCLGVAFGLGPLLEPAPSRSASRAWTTASEGAA